MVLLGKTVRRDRSGVHSGVEPRAWLMDGMLGVRKRMGSRISLRFLARITGCTWFHLLYYDR